MAKDFYRILGVDRKADEKAIKAAYRKLARQYHPDVNPGDKSAEAKFKEISEAYEVLGDSEKRKLYDQFGEHWEHAGNFAGGFQGGVPGGGDFHFGPGGFEQIFEQFFGAGRGMRFEDFDNAQPRDIEKTIEVSLEDIDAGCKRTLTYQTMDANRTMGGVASVPTTKKVEITIPAGIANGRKLRIAGKGHAGVNGKAGDLYVVVKWAPHSLFQVNGDHLEVDVPVDFTVAALGGEVKVATLRSTVRMRIPEGTQSGQTFRLAGQGIAKHDGGRSDLMARIKITVPKRLSPAERELLERLQSLQEATV